MIPVASADLGELEKKYLTEAFESGYISGTGPFVERFEREFALSVHAEHSVACSSGTTALHLVLKSLGIGPGDQVIVPDLTYVATANAVSYCGATPVFADVEPDTWCISARTIEPLLRGSTVGIIPVHLYGHPCDMGPILRLADSRGLFVVEDAAQAHGARACGQPMGDGSTAATYSFYGNKLMTTGEGGMITTDDLELADHVRRLRGHAMDPDRRYHFTEIGFNYRMPNLCAAIGLAQLERLTSHLERRRHLVNIYRDQLSTPLQLRCQQEQSWARSAWWLFSVILRGGAPDRRRAETELRKAGIDTRPVFPPLSDQPFHVPAHTPVAHTLAAGGLNLPTGVHVRSNHIVTIRDVLSAFSQLPESLPEL